jgi:hypothetical protein
VTTPSDPYGPPGEGQQQGQPQWGPPPQPGPGAGAYGAPPAQGWGQAPEGGQPGWGAPAPQKTGLNGLALGSVITAFFCWPLGLVLGIVAKGQIKRTGQSGDGLATAGIVLAVLNALVSVYLVSQGFGRA